MNFPHAKHRPYDRWHKSLICDIPKHQREKRFLDCAPVYPSTPLIQCEPLDKDTEWPADMPPFGSMHYVTGKYGDECKVVRYSSRRGCWVDRMGNEIDPPEIWWEYATYY